MSSSTRTRAPAPRPATVWSSGLLVLAVGAATLCGCARKGQPTEVAQAVADPPPVPQPAPDNAGPKDPAPKAEAPKSEKAKSEKAKTPPKVKTPPVVRPPSGGVKLPPKEVPERPVRPAKKFELENFPPADKWVEFASPSKAWSVRFPEQPLSVHRRYDLPGGAVVEADEGALDRAFTSACVMLVRDDYFDRRPSTDEFEEDNQAFIARVRGIYGLPAGDPKAATLKTNGHFTRDYTFRGDALANFDLRRVLVIGKTKVRILTALAGGPAVRDEDRQRFIDSLKIAAMP